MTNHAVAARSRSKNRTGQLAGKSRPTGRSISPMLLTFQQIYPEQTALELALRTKADVRHCERCLAGTRELGAVFQQRLLQSDVGREILIALMGDAKPAWWVALQRQMKLSAAHHGIAALQRELEQIQEEIRQEVRREGSR